MRLLAPLLLLLALTPARAEDVTVFAAASTGAALQEIAADWHTRTGNSAVIAPAGSSAIARQVQAGAPADLVLLASADWMDVLEEGGLLTPGSRVDLLGNRLALVGHGDQPPVEIGPDLDLSGRLGDGRLAMALVQAVPAGIYGKAALERLGLWEGVAAHVAQADNVRAALAFVAAGATPLGIVYATDVGGVEGVTLLALFPEDTHPPIIYPLATIGPEPTSTARCLPTLRTYR